MEGFYDYSLLLATAFEAMSRSGAILDIDLSKRDLSKDEDNLVLRIMASRSFMTEGERRVSDYLLKHQSAAYAISQAELARACGVSAPTISRYVKRLGQKNYHAFQVAFARAGFLMHDGASREELGSTLSIDDVTKSLRELLKKRADDLAATIEALSNDNFIEAVDSVARTRTLLIAAAGRTLPVALDAAYKFERLGIRCPTSLYYEKLLSSAILLERDDVLLVISRSGWTGTLQQVAFAAKDNGAIIVLITENAESPLVNMADYVFVAHSSDGMLDGRGGNSRLSEMFIVEALYALVALRKDDGVEHIEKHYRYVMSETSLP